MYDEREEQDARKAVLHAASATLLPLNALSFGHAQETARPRKNMHDNTERMSLLCVCVCCRVKQRVWVFPIGSCITLLKMAWIYVMLSDLSFTPSSTHSCASGRG